MDIIYSRKRIKVSKKIEGYKNSKNAKKIFSIFIIIIITFITFYSILKSVGPIFEGLCLEKVREIGTNIINDASNKILNNTDYSKVVSIDKNENGNFLKTDVVVINKIASDIALEAQQQFKELENQEIKIPIGSLTGINFLSGVGPNININVVPVRKHFYRTKERV